MREERENNLPLEPEQSKVLHLGIPIASRTPLNNPLHCKVRDMTPSPENETCEETSRRTQEQESKQTCLDGREGEPEDWRQR